MELIKLLQSFYAETLLNTSFQLHFAALEIVILDLIMPVIDGRRCLDEILRINPKARIVIASGYSESGPANGVWIPEQRITVNYD